MTSTCECSEDYGPCESHSDVLAQRAGASSRSADELLAVFIGDVEAILAAEGVDVSEDAGMRGAISAATEYWERYPSGGWVDVDDEPDLAERLHDGATYGAEGALPAGVYVWWEDGYVISRITGGPLVDR